MNRKELANAVYDISNIKGEFLLRSGTVSNEYFDKYLFEAQPHLLKEISESMASLIPDGIDVLAGLEMGGIPVVKMSHKHLAFHPCLSERRQRIMEPLKSLKVAK